jgi:hypothetical protein
MFVSAFDKDLNYDWKVDGGYREFTEVSTGLRLFHQPNTLLKLKRFFLKRT